MRMGDRQVAVGSTASIYALMVMCERTKFAYGLTDGTLVTQHIS